MAKPTDFFVGVTDLFSILLPGACIAFIAMKLEHSYWMSEGTMLGLEKDTGYVAFFIVAYVVGHLMDMAGAYLWDKLYDKTYHRWKCRSVNNTQKNPLRDEAERLALPGMAVEGNVYQWCKSWVCLQSSAAFTEIERLLANSKFFRGLVSVFLLSATLCFASKPAEPRFLIGEMVCVLLSFFAFLRFCVLRWKTVQLTYRFFIALRLAELGEVAVGSSVHEK